MEKLDPRSLREHALKRNVELHSPYEVVDKRKVSTSKKREYLIYYTAPRGGEREQVMDGIADKETAKDFLELLNRAWALGYMSSGFTG